MSAAASGPASPLRPYQEQVARAVVDSVVNKRGLSFSVEMARQGGKNEVSARVELLLLVLNVNQPVMGVKAAPTLVPQAMISMRRLQQRVRLAGLDSIAGLEDGHIVRLGLARMAFLSAEPESNVVGHTADLILEVDEAQDIDEDKFDRDFRPMAASTAATTVYYGTAWDDASLLEKMKQVHLDAERRDGVKRHFEYDWEVVAQSNPAYGRYVVSERERLGADHPLFLTQYCLKPLPGKGRMFGPAARGVLQGAHGRLDGPVAGETYVAGVDVGGSGELTGSVGHDSTVLTIARVVVVPGVGREQLLGCEVVRHYAWTGGGHEDVWGALVALLGGTWRVTRVLVDATGLGEPLAEHLARALGPWRVEAVKLGQASKSELGFGLVAAVSSGRCRCYAGDGSAEYAEFWQEIERARVDFLPSLVMRFYVPDDEGHDDYLVSLALAVGAVGAGAPRVARGREQA